MTNATILRFMNDKGPGYGYFPESGKPIYICKGEDKTVVRTAFEAEGIMDVTF